MKTNKILNLCLYLKGIFKQRNKQKKNLVFNSTAGVIHLKKVYMALYVYFKF